MKGQCYCGKIKYEVQPPLKFVAHDHCSICRRISGAAFVTWAGVPESQFKFTHGEEHLKKFKSTAEAVRQFCSHCGSHLTFQSTRWPNEMHFTAASLIDKLESPPKAHVFYSDKVEWLENRDNLPKLGGKTGTEPLSAESLK